MTALAPILQAFFTDRLIRQRQASPHTIAAYRDTFRLLLALRPAAHRHAALRSWTWPTWTPTDRRVPRPPGSRPGQQRAHPQRPAGRHPLAVPLRRLQAPRARRDSSSGSWPSRQAHQHRPRHLPHRRRDATRCSPPPTRAPGPAAATTPCSCSRCPDRAARLRTDRADLRRHPPRPRAHVRCLGKGRKERTTPLTIHRRRAAGLAGRTRRQPRRPAVPHPPGQRLCPDAIQARLTKYHARAARLPVAGRKKITPHTLRHTSAMSLLHAGVDIAVIALWLGHFSGVPELSQVASFST